jgi:serine/threonine protein kinase
MSNPRSAPPDLDEFSFVRGIGGGGFADVFLYQQRRPNRPVAIKVLRAEHLSDESLRQFEVEADLMAEVSTHPYIVSIYSAHVASDGRPYIVMEYYPQPHFGIRARGGVLPIAEVLQVAIQVCSAVETAHRQGIIHRDIKPANILTSAYNRPGLTDFGIAGVQVEGVADAAAGVSIGYTAPEVLSDERMTGSIAGDVYSLGATIYSLVAGRAPFWIPGGDNSDHQLWTRVLSGKAPPTGREGVPPTLENLLIQTLATNPASRPSSALALARALQDVEQGLRLPPTPIEALLDAPSMPNAPIRADDHEADGTRRGGAQVVDPDPQPMVASPPPGPTPTNQWTPPAPPLTGSAAPANPAEVEEPATRMRSGTSPQPDPPARAGRTSAASSDLTDERSETVRRDRSAPASTVDEEEPSARSFPWIWVGVAAGALVLVGMVVVVLSGGETATDDPVTTGPPPTLVDASRPGPPSNVETDFDDGGTLIVTFDPPAEADGVRYQLTRTDGSPRNSWPDGEYALIAPDADVEIVGFDPDELPEEICFQVEAVSAAGALSEPTPETCVEP